MIVSPPFIKTPTRKDDAMRLPATVYAAAFALVSASLAAPGATASEAISKKAGCALCHAASKTGIGPSYAEIAQRYKGNAAIAAKLEMQVRKGSKGAWGKNVMPATGTDKLSDPDLKAVIAWILKS
jgi:cytochrome c